jgi:hypothetical protein
LAALWTARRATAPENADVRSQTRLVPPPSSAHSHSLPAPFSPWTCCRRAPDLLARRRRMNPWLALVAATLLLAGGLLGGCWGGAGEGARSDAAAAGRRAHWNARPRPPRGRCHSRRLLATQRASGVSRSAWHAPRPAPAHQLLCRGTRRPRRPLQASSQRQARPMPPSARNTAGECGRSWWVWA